jgi:hypothetical protein
MRLTERAMLRIASDLRADDRAAAAVDHQRWVKEGEPSPTARVERVESRTGWSRFWRLPSIRQHA